MHSVTVLFGRVVILLLPLLCAGEAASSYGIYVGRSLTADGSVFLGGSGDEVSSHWLEIVAARTHPPGDTMSRHDYRQVNCRE